MKNKMIISAFVALLLLFMIRIIFYQTSFEFRWNYLNVFAELAFPTSLIVLAFAYTPKIKKIGLRIFITSVIAVGSFFVGLVYLFITPSGQGEYTFQSNSKKNTVIVKEYSCLLMGSVSFYKPQYFIVKKKLKGKSHGTDDGYCPFKAGTFSNDWNQAESICTFHWEDDHLSGTWNSETIEFN